MRILVIEDNRDILANILDYLELKGFIVDCAQDGLSGMHLALTQPYNLIVLDIMLPGMDGYQICQKLRQEAGNNTPIIMLTARDALDDRLVGLNAGAEDYLVKPFDVVELLARVEVVLRRFHKRGAQLSAGDVVVDMEARMVTKAGVPVVLTNKEYGLLVLFIQNKNIALFKESLYEKVWGEEYDGDSRTLELHVQRLRKKMGWENQLVAVYKVGYRLEIA